MSEAKSNVGSLPDASLNVSNATLTMPRIGLGTWRSPPGKVYDAVLHALRSGYRHIDCAWAYRNEQEVGKAIKEFLSSDPSVKREDLFVTSKLWSIFHTDDPEDGNNRVRGALEETLRDLQLDYVDLYLIHWPVAMEPVDPNNLPSGVTMQMGIFPTKDGSRLLNNNATIQATYRAMERLADAGLTKAIGVSNMDVEDVQHVLSFARHPPAVNQVEVHAFLTQQSLIEFCTKANIVVTAYSPLGNVGKPPLCLDDPVVVEIAAKYSKTPAQLLLRFGVQLGCVVIPKSVTPSRIEENFDIQNFEISDDDMQSLKSLNKDLHMVNPQWWPETPFWPRSGRPAASN